MKKKKCLLILRLLTILLSPAFAEKRVGYHSLKHDLPYLLNCTADLEIADG
jgi:hypothetical protein